METHHDKFYLPFFKKSVFDYPEDVLYDSPEYRSLMKDIQEIETESRIQLFHGRCYLDTVRNGGSSLG